MDTNPETLVGQAESTDASSESGSVVVSVPNSPTQTPPPERLAEKRRREEEEDDDELMKLAAGPKRRSSTSSNSSAGILNRKKTLSIGPIGATEKPGTGMLGSSAAAPKRIAINLGPMTKSAAPDTDTSSTADVPSETNENEKPDDSKGDGSG